MTNSTTTTTTKNVYCAACDDFHGPGRYARRSCVLDATTTTNQDDEVCERHGEPVDCWVCLKLKIYGG